MATSYILIVDDEPILVMTMEEALVEAGFDVLPASSADDALGQLEAKLPDIRALVTDIRMPGTVSGWELARRARELNPRLAVVYVTGDNATDWPHEGVPRSLVLNKPFAYPQLVTAISNLLNASDQAEAVNEQEPAPEA